MIITDRTPVGHATPGHYRDYRRCPGHLPYAICAAVHTAKRLGEEVVIVPGNSYMHRVYHLARRTARLAYYTGMRIPVSVIVAAPDGSLYRATAEDDDLD